MTDMTDEITAAAESMLRRIDIDTQTPAAGTDDGIWAAFTEAGFTTVAVPDDGGEPAGDVVDALAVLTALTRAGAVTPMIEHGLLACWLADLIGTGIEGDATAAIADTSVTARTVDGKTVLTGTIDDIVHLDRARTVVVWHSDHGVGRIAVIDLHGPGVERHVAHDLMGVGVGRLTLHDAIATADAAAPVGRTEVELRGALAYATAMAAAARSVTDATARYAGERTQFGRPLTAFQAIGQRLASMAARTSLMETAVAAAQRAVAIDTDSATAIACAKTVTSAQAHAIATAGHQIHGAIGFTSESPLGRSTTALWTWRDRYGSERRWATAIADQILDDDTDPWDVVVGAGDVGLTPAVAVEIDQSADEE